MRVLVIFPGALGDFLLLAPALAALARAGARLELSVCRTLEPLARALLDAATGPPADGGEMSSLFTREPTPGLAAWLAGADQVHAWLGSKAGTPELEVWLHARALPTIAWHSVVRTDGARHASRVYADAVGVKGALPVPRLVLGGMSAAPEWRGEPPRRLVVHPGAGAATKRWPRRGFLTVTERWRTRGGEVMVVLGPAEDHTRRFWERAGERVVAGLDVMTAAALLASAPLYVGNDSGISHLAGTLGRRGAILFGPTRPERWRPRGGSLVPVHFAPGAHDVAAVVLERLEAAVTLTPPGATISVERSNEVKQ